MECKGICDICINDCKRYFVVYCPTFIQDNVKADKIKKEKENNEKHRRNYFHLVMCGNHRDC